MLRRVALLALLTASPVAGQVVAIRTVPLPRWQQFDQLPSSALAMGGLGVAYVDSLLDPFVNPARAGSLAGTRLFLAPGQYRTNQNPEVGVSLPIGGLVRFGDWFAGAAFSWQDVSITDPPSTAACPVCDGFGFNLTAPTPNQTNRYGHLLAGHRFDRAGLSLGAAISWSDLNWVQGLYQLYASSARIDHRGSTFDFRLGAVKDLPGGRSLSALLLRDRTSATHDVVFLDWQWDTLWVQGHFSPRREENLDRSSLWGLHLQYLWPLKSPGWQAGLIATGNLVSHPKLPDYVIQSIQIIPRDPGSSTATAFGVGVYRTGSRTSYGYEAVVEPIWSNTWAEADGPIPAAGGGIIGPGQKTIENWFRFVNLSVRGGFGRVIQLGSGPETMTLRGGLQLHRVEYALRQRDYVADGGRKLNHGWTEITPTWGLAFNLGSVGLQYRGSATAMSVGDLLGLNGGDLVVTAPPAADGPPILATPEGQVRFSGSRAMVHQLSVVVPIH